MHESVRILTTEIQHDTMCINLFAFLDVISGTKLQSYDMSHSENEYVEMLHDLVPSCFLYFFYFVSNSFDLSVGAFV